MMWSDTPVIPTQQLLRAHLLALVSILQYTLHIRFTRDTTLRHVCTQDAEYARQLDQELNTVRAPAAVDRDRELALALMANDLHVPTGDTVSFHV